MPIDRLEYSRYNTKVTRKTERTHERKTNMTIAEKIEILKGWINGCIELRDLACMNFDMTEEQVIEEVNYYEACIAQYAEQKAGLEVWA